MYTDKNAELLLDQLEKLKYKMFEDIENHYSYNEFNNDYIYDTFNTYFNMMYTYSRKILSINPKYKKDIELIKYDIMDFFQNKFPNHIDIVREKMNM